MFVPADEQLSLISDGCCEVASVKRTFKLRNLLEQMMVMMIFSNVPNVTLHLNIFKISKHIRAQLNKSLKYSETFAKQLNSLNTSHNFVHLSNLKFSSD
jgi:hypothetical protein